MIDKLSPAACWLLILFVSGASAQFKPTKKGIFTERTEIQKFNFLNALYEAGCEGEKVRVQNGHYEPKKSGGAYFELNVSVSLEI